MPTILTHAIAGATVAQLLAPSSRRGEITWTAAACAMLPDIDVLGLSLGIPYGDLFGHRGFTHSLLFAGVVALAVTGFYWGKANRRDFLQILAAIFVATASHGVLDAFTNGGLGVAFFSPFDLRRYFFPIRPIEVSPLGVAALLTERGASVLRSEILWVWTPSICVFITAVIVRRRRRAWYI